MKTKKLFPVLLLLGVLAFSSCSTSTGSCYLDLTQLSQTLFDSYQSQRGTRGPEKGSDSDVVGQAVLDVQNRAGESRAKTTEFIGAKDKSVVLRIDSLPLKEDLVAYISIGVLEAEDRFVELYKGRSDFFSLESGKPLALSVTMNQIGWKVLVEDPPQLPSNNLGQSLILYHEAESFPNINISEKDPFWNRIFEGKIEYRKATVVDGFLFLFGELEKEMHVGSGPEETFFLLRAKIDPSIPFDSWAIDFRKDCFFFIPNAGFDFFLASPYALVYEDNYENGFIFDLKNPDLFKNVKKFIKGSGDEIELLVPLTQDLCFFVSDSVSDEVGIVQLVPNLTDDRHRLEQVSSFKDSFEKNGIQPDPASISLVFRYKNDVYFNYGSYFLQIGPETRGTGKNEWLFKSFLNLDRIFFFSRKQENDSERRGNLQYIIDSHAGVLILKYDEEGAVSLEKHVGAFDYEKVSIVNNWILFKGKGEDKTKRFNLDDQINWSF